MFTSTECFAGIRVKKIGNTIKTNTQNFTSVIKQNSLKKGKILTIYRI